MEIDWALFTRYAAPILALFVGAILNRFLERRPRLVSYLWHTSAVTLRPPAAPPISVFGHSIVVRNGGKKPAINVRLGHQVLPAFSVYPSVRYEVVDLPDGSQEIVFPSLVPGEQVTVAYLYFPPTLWNNVNSYTKSDEGFAKIINVLPVQQWSRWLAAVAWLLIAVGLITTVYSIAEFILFLVRHFR